MQKVLACVDWYSKDSANAAKIGVIGWGEGGLLALYAGALDPRIDAVCVSGYFDNRNNIWQEPIDRNVFGLLEQFGDAELASMIAPRALVVEAARGPEATIPGGRERQPASSRRNLRRCEAKWIALRKLWKALQPPPTLELIVSGEDGRGAYGSEPAVSAFLKALGCKRTTLANARIGQSQIAECAARCRRAPCPTNHELDRHSQWLLRESQYVRKENFWNKLNYESLDKYNESIEPFRKVVCRRGDWPL